MHPTLTPVTHTQKKATKYSLNNMGIKHAEELLRQMNA